MQLLNSDYKHEYNEQSTITQPIILEFRTVKGVEKFAASSILLFASAGKYSYLFTANEEKPLIIFHALNEVENFLKDLYFERCSRYHVVNLTHCKSFRHKKKDGIAVIGIGEKRWEVNITRTYKASFIRRLSEYKGRIQ